MVSLLASLAYVRAAAFMYQHKSALTEELRTAAPRWRMAVLAESAENLINPVKVLKRGHLILNRRPPV